MDAKALAGVTMMLGNAALTGISGGATTNSSTACGYAIKGKAYAHATDSGVATPTTDVDGNAITLVASQARNVVWCLDASDAIKLVAGPVVPLDAAGGYVNGGVPLLPGVPADLCPYAIVTHKASSSLSGTFTVGSSNWNVAGMTHTVTSLCTLPERPPV